ncbi:DUF1329 domain-containing protein [Endozoicomonas sp. OPT23]|uniref:DUF1329 domain-containing protein n=1 Tax=Endozoicomonas sp. OPT23 TaxID=2072845 RepID=UPI00129A22A3|nr:DUF1329 domain-containing protein [Endozoicomonas sp. OPT23]MRI33822.1 DUF1329 domain-containing protein [Endozoicomonas sp. OPT23]
MIIRTSLLVMGISALMTAGSVSAKVSPEEAAKLGKELTPVGAERAGNAEGTIPEWNPEIKIPASYKGTGHHLPNPYADENPLFVISKDNLDQYKDKLSAGQIALFKTYPDTFKMKVYPSHRNGSYSDFVHQNTKINATTAELAPGGNGVRNAWGGAPFPIPQSGEEAIWNLSQGGGMRYNFTVAEQAIVYRDGSRLMGRATHENFAPYFDPQSSREAFLENQHPKLLYLTQALAPAREKGAATMIHLPLDTSAQPRSAWTYSPGVRRVRRAPTIGYDNFEGLGKFRTVDSGAGFNGATDRYNWKLLGKKELYIPYNTYDFDSPELNLEELLTKNHINPEHMRYELHRVWVVEATLKEGERNVFKKRVLHFDEDSWHPSVVDMYDNRGDLWRVSMMNTLTGFDFKGVRVRNLVYHDLLSKEYMVDNLINRTAPFDLSKKANEISYFKPSTLRKLGVR